METFITPEFFELITEQEAKFILDHAEKQLKDTNETNLIIASRSAQLLTITVGVVVAIMGFAVNRYLILQHADQMVITAAVAAAYLYGVCLIICFNLVPKSYFIAGAEPKDFFIPEMFNNENADYRLIAIYVNEICEVQVKIKHNKKINARRWKLFNTSLFLIAGLPTVLALVYWLH